MLVIDCALGPWPLVFARLDHRGRLKMGKPSPSLSSQNIGSSLGTPPQQWQCLESRLFSPMLAQSCKKKIQLISFDLFSQLEFFLFITPEASYCRNLPFA